MVLLEAILWGGFTFGHATFYLFFVLDQNQNLTWCNNILQKHFCMYVSMYMYICMCMYVYVCMSMPVYQYVYVCMYVCMCRCKYVNVYIYVCTYACVYQGVVLQNHQPLGNKGDNTYIQHLMVNNNKETTPPNTTLHSTCCRALI